MNEPYDQHGSVTGISFLDVKKKKKKEVAEAYIECDCSYKALKSQYKLFRNHTGVHIIRESQG